MTVLYSKQGCSPCNLLKRLFDSKGVEYEIRDISVEEHRQELAEKYQVQMVPVTVINGEPIIGLNMQAIMKKISAV